MLSTAGKIAKPLWATLAAIATIATLATASLASPPPSALASDHPSVQLSAPVGSLSPGSPLSVNFSWGGRVRGMEAFFVVYSRIESRSALASLSSQGPLGNPLALTNPQPLARLGSRGRFTLRAANPLATTGCGTQCAGVYPVELRVADARTGATAGQMLLTVPVLPPSTAANPLKLAVTVQVRPPAYSRGLLRSLRTSLETPYTYSYTLEGAPGTSYSALLADSRALPASPYHQRVLSPYAPTYGSCERYLPPLLALSSSLALSGGVNGSGPVVLDPLPPSSSQLAGLVKQGKSEMIVPDSLLASFSPVLSLSSPVRFSSYSAAGTSALLGSELAGSGTPAGYQRLISDVAQFYLEAPGKPGRVALATEVVSNAAQFGWLDAGLARLSQTPFVSLVSAPQALAAAPIQATSTGLFLPSSKSCPLKLDRLRRYAGPIEALSSAAGGFPEPVQSMVGYLQIAGSTAQGAGGRAAATRRLQSAVKAASGSVGVTGSTTITLTSQTASLPITVESSLPYRVKLTMSLNSSKLSFPAGSSRSIELNSSTATVSIPVVVKALGSFPATVYFRSPSGRVVATTSILIDSTGFSVVGVVLTVAAVAVFVAWWIRTLRASRTARRGANGAASQD